MTQYAKTRACFTVSSKEGTASLDIQNPWAGQSLLLPLHPSSAVAEVLPHLYAAAAHYGNCTGSSIEICKFHFGLVKLLAFRSFSI